MLTSTGLWLPVCLAAAAAAAAGRPSSARTRVTALGRTPIPPAAREPSWPRPTRQMRSGAASSVSAGPAVAVAAAAAALVVLGAVAAVVAGLAAELLRRARSARRDAVAAAVERARALEAFAVLSAELRAGRPAPDALSAAAQSAVGSTRSALAAGASAALIGGDVAAALVSPASPAADALRSLAACWTVCAASGSGLGAGVERLTEGLRAAEAQRRTLDAELAGPRATAVLLAGLPGIGVAMAAALGADPLHVLLETPVGVVCLATGLGLDVLGLLWTRRLVARAGGG